MASGYCPLCGDASGERHLCVPVTCNANTPPPIVTQEANAARVTALEAENARLRAVLARYADVIGEDALLRGEG